MLQVATVDDHNRFKSSIFNLAAALQMREKLKKQHGIFEVFSLGFFEDRDRFGDECLVADMGVTFDFSSAWESWWYVLNY